MFKKDRDDDYELPATVFSDDVGKLILRLTIGGLMLLHGIAKIQNGIGGIEGMLDAKGLPTFIAYGVYVGEIVVPILIILGIFTRPSALIFVFNMVIAIWLAHAGDLLKLGEHGGWAIELPALYLLGALAIVFLGPGALSLRRRTGLMA